MKQVPITEAKEVVNKNNGAESWSVEKSFLCDDGKTAVVLVSNTNSNKHCDSVIQLQNSGYVGFA